MAKNPITEDYFQDTTMTFGEHLDELRKVLVKAVIGLGIGVLLGLLGATYVMRFVQRPLERALEKYYVERDLDEMKRRYGLEENDTDRLRELIKKRHASISYVYLEEAELLRLARAVAGGKENSSPGMESASAEPGGADAESVAEKPGIPEDTGRLVLTRIWTPLRAKVTSLSAQEAFMIWMKAGFLAGFVLASPYIFLQLWSFVAAGLYPHEQRYIYVYLPFSIGLFLLGASTAFFLVFDPVLQFLFDFNRSLNIDPDPRISYWISFVLVLPLGFGIAFQLPLVMLFLHRLGIISVAVYTEKWRIAVLAIFIISMVLTPADPISMLAMAIPLTALYFVGLGMCLWMPRIRSPFREE